MKKLTADTPVTFQYDGVTLLDIDREGVLVRDAVAKVAFERLGDQIVVEDAGPDGGVDADTEDVDTGPSLTDLKARAEELGLKKSGTKAELAERIAAEETRLSEEEEKDVIIDPPADTVDTQ